ncbi:MAG: sodium:proton antiporter NhaD [Rhizobiales bacterium]|nr:sodium:proton antiporter NhaD [Hyphomicrobiales bacterium]
MPDAAPALDLTQTWVGVTALAIFGVAYLLVILEEATQLRKSKPVLVAAGLIWALIGMAYTAAGQPDAARAQAEHTIFEYGELFLFLLVAITYVNTLEERRVFEVVRARLTARSLSYRQLFWITGALAFALSGVLDNLTTALVMGSVVLAVGTASPRFVTLACISVVVAANAGGAFTPFGDITTLMVWQKGKVSFFEFFALFGPALVNWLVPAVALHFALPADKPPPARELVAMKPGARGVIVLFALTIATAVAFRNFLGLQPALGMMLGLGYLQIWSYILQQRGKRSENTDMVLNSFRQIERIEWDTLLFFFGIIFAVGGLGVMGYLALINEHLYGAWGNTAANVTVGLLSSVLDNIPIMFAVLTMDPQMSHGQWLLVTLTAGVGGSLLSIGSAAGVALMGLAQGNYTFSHHLRWTWAIALGYAASIVAHLVINAAKF